jgi:hypothetical protein
MFPNIVKNLAYRWSTRALCFTEKFSRGFEGLTVVTRKNTVFWVVISCSPATVNRRFNGTYCLLLQCRTVSHAIYQQKQEAVCRSFLSTPAGFFSAILLYPESLHTTGPYKVEYRIFLTYYWLTFCNSRETASKLRRNTIADIADTAPELLTELYIWRPDT